MTNQRYPECCICLKDAMTVSISPFNKVGDDGHLVRLPFDICYGCLAGLAAEGLLDINPAVVTLYAQRVAAHSAKCASG